MTTRETLRQWMEQLSEEDLEELARLLTERGTTVPAQRAQRRSEPAWIEAGDYPALAAIWDNDDDSIFDELVGATMWCSSMSASPTSPE